MTILAVLITAYKAERTIEETLDSLYKNKEPHDIYIVDDGSPVPLEDVLTPRENVTILRSSANLGVALARNLGLKTLLTKDYAYVAFIDADDAASPDRLERQRVFLDQHPEIGLVGGWGRVVSETGETLFHLHPPQDHEAILRCLSYNNCFLQPSLMLRADLFRKYGVYSNDYPSAEDYEIVRRFLQYTKAANIQDYLLIYTISSQGISQTKRCEQLRSRLKVQLTYCDLFSVHTYLGICKSIALYLLPDVLVCCLKRHLKSYDSRVRCHRL
jgi:glycosyltransferase involved in cell wall biosynthesis